MPLFLYQNFVRNLSFILGNVSVRSVICPSSVSADHRFDLSLGQKAQHAWRATSSAVGSAVHDALSNLVGAGSIFVRDTRHVSVFLGRDQEARFFELLEVVAGFRTKC